jgi:dienelactone hydrolase
MIEEDRDVVVRAGRAALDGSLGLPDAPRGIVVFAHGSGSTHLTCRNRYVAECLNEAGFATLLFDLLTLREQAIDHYSHDLRNDRPRLVARLTGALDWLARRPELCDLPLGLFGARSGAAAVLQVAAQYADRVSAVVVRGGRPDVSGEVLAGIRAPTLLVVGSLDPGLPALARQAAARLRAEHRVEVLAGAGHYFSEPHTLTAAAELARDWFLAHLRERRRPVMLLSRSASPAA